MVPYPLFGLLRSDSCRQLFWLHFKPKPSNPNDKSLRVVAYSSIKSLLRSCTRVDFMSKPRTNSTLNHQRERYDKYINPLSDAVTSSNVTVRIEVTTENETYTLNNVSEIESLVGWEIRVDYVDSQSYIDHLTAVNSALQQTSFFKGKSKTPITGSSEKMKLWSLWGNALGFSGTAVKSFLPNDYDMKKEYDNMGVKLVDNKWMHQL